MSSQYYRVKKGQSLLLSLYSVSLLPIFLYASLAFLLVWTLFFNFNTPASIAPIFYILLSTLKMVSFSVLLSLFIAAAISFYFLSHKNIKSLRLLKFLFYQLNEMPIIVCGIFPLYFFGQSSVSFYIIYVIIAVPKLASRWLKCSQKVRLVELEALRSIGFNSIQAFKILYYDQFYKLYLFHALSVFCLMFFVVTPFVWLQNRVEKPLALQIFFQLGEPSRNLSFLMLIFIGIFIVKFWIDHKLKSLEVENV